MRLAIDNFDTFAKAAGIVSYDSAVPQGWMDEQVAKDGIDLYNAKGCAVWVYDFDSDETAQTFGAYSAHSCLGVPVFAYEIAHVLGLVTVK